MLNEACCKGASDPGNGSVEESTPEAMLDFPLGEQRGETTTGQMERAINAESMPQVAQGNAGCIFHILFPESSGIGIQIAQLLKRKPQ